MLTLPIEPLPQLRCGIIGFGAMGKKHAEVLRSHPYFKLGGITSTPAQAGVSENYGCRWFESAEQMIASGDPALAPLKA
jgi:predicted dehydrogenase